jgi:hypothetical protein
MIGAQPKFDMYFENRRVRKIPAVFLGGNTGVIMRHFFRFIE